MPPELIKATYTRNQWKRNTCIFDIYLTWTCASTFCFHQTTVLYIFYQKIIDFFVLIDCQCALFKSTCSKTSYLTPCNVLHEWFVFLHLALLADWVDYILPTSKCRYVFSVSKYSKIKFYKIVNNFRAGGSGKLESHYLSCVWTFTPFRLYLEFI